MPRGPHERKFEADISRSLYESFERWAEGRGRISNRQILVAMFRLFLSAPETLKMAALYGTDDQIDFTVLRATQTPEEVRADIEHIRRLADDFDDEALSQVTPEERAVVFRIREMFGPDAVVRPAAPGEKRAAGRRKSR